MMKLKDLVFSDLFVAEDLATSWYKQTPDSMTVHFVPDALSDEFYALRDKLLSLGRESNGFGVDWPSDDGQSTRLRVGHMRVSNGKSIFICRRFGVVPGPLTSLGVPRNIAQRFLAPELKDGLVVFMGKAGSGKTTTAGSFLIQRLESFGGVCWTVENPIEIPLQGRHGKGWCYQTEASCDDDIGPAISDMLRATPNMIFIGEMRDSKTVREAIKAGNSGHLVVATFHAGDLKSGIARLAFLAQDDRASSALADALRVGVHLTLYTHEEGKRPPGMIDVTSRGTGTPPRILSVSPLWFTEKSADALKSNIRDGRFEMLSSEVERQERALMMGTPITRREV